MKKQNSKIQKWSYLLNGKSDKKEYRMKKSKIIFTLLFAVITIFISGCSSRPSNDDIKNAIYQSLEHKVPMSLAAKGWSSGKNATIEELRIIKIGNAQVEDSYKYWPVIIYAKGTSTILMGSRKSFAGEIEYYVKKDPYGKWIASHSKYFTN